MCNRYILRSFVTRYHQVQIARYETGRNTPPIEYLVRFCQHYHVSADYILGLPKNSVWPR